MTSEPQTSDSVLLVRPASFGFHAEAAATNVFARQAQDPEISALALGEFNLLAERLGDAGVAVLVMDDAPTPAKPDAVFPNNWVSFHADGTLVLYPMATAARRLERDLDALRSCLATGGFRIERIVDLSGFEWDGWYLEGTGSLILDRPNRRAYAGIGPRTDANLVALFDEALGYSTMTFDAHDRAGRPIYHTNVLLSLGTEFAVICPDAVPSDQRPMLLQEIRSSGRTLIEVDFDQLHQFACNLIELRSNRGDPLIALSSAARAAFRPDQLKQLEGFGELVEVPIPTIEGVGGGSVRCMIADIHLPRG